MSKIKNIFWGRIRRRIKLTWKRTSTRLIRRQIVSKALFVWSMTLAKLCSFKAETGLPFWSRSFIAWIIFSSISGNMFGATIKPRASIVILFLSTCFEQSFRSARTILRGFECVVGSARIKRFNVRIFSEIVCETFGIVRNDSANSCGINGSGSSRKKIFNTPANSIGEYSQKSSTIFLEMSKDFPERFKSSSICFFNV